MRKIRVICPICNSSKRIEIPLEIFNIDEGSLLKLPIRKRLICEHSFIILIDYNFSIRDYEIPKTEGEFKQLISKSITKEKSFEYFF